MHQIAMASERRTLRHWLEMPWAAAWAFITGARSLSEGTCESWSLGGWEGEASRAKDGTFVVQGPISYLTAMSRSRCRSSAWRRSSRAI